jgi:hypothetical protein
MRRILALQKLGRIVLKILQTALPPVYTGRRRREYMAVVVGDVQESASRLGMPRLSEFASDEMPKEYWQAIIEVDRVWRQYFVGILAASIAGVAVSIGLSIWLTLPEWLESSFVPTAAYILVTPVAFVLIMRVAKRRRLYLRLWLIRYLTVSVDMLQTDQELYSKDGRRLLLVFLERASKRLADLAVAQCDGSRDRFFKHRVRRQFAGYSAYIAGLRDAVAAPDDGSRARLVSALKPIIIAVISQHYAELPSA